MQSQSAVPIHVLYVPPHASGVATARTAGIRNHTICVSPPSISRPSSRLPESFTVTRRPGAVADPGPGGESAALLFATLQHYVTRVIVDNAEQIRSGIYALREPGQGRSVAV